MHHITICHFFQSWLCNFECWYTHTVSSIKTARDLQIFSGVQTSHEFAGVTTWRAFNLWSQQFSGHLHYQCWDKITSQYLLPSYLAVHLFIIIIINIIVNELIMVHRRNRRERRHMSHGEIKNKYLTLLSVYSGIVYAVYSADYCDIAVQFVRIALSPCIQLSRDFCRVAHAATAAVKMWWKLHCSLIVNHV